MAISISTLYSVQDFVSWMQENLCPKYFSSIVFTSGSATYQSVGTYEFFDPDVADRVIFKISVSDNFITKTNFTIYRGSSDSGYINVQPGGYDGGPLYITNSKPAIAAICDGGAYLRINCQYADTPSSPKWETIDIVFTKSNNDKTVCIVGVSLTADASLQTRISELGTNVYCGTWDDAATSDNKLVFSANQQYQTQFLPFATLVKDFNTISYTPNVFYMPTGQYYTAEFGKIESNGSVYITNGYWAIKDAN